MPEFSQLLPYFAASLIPLFLLLIAPLLRNTGNLRILGVLILGALVSAGYGFLTWGESRTVEVINPFPRGPNQEVFAFVTDTVTKPAGLWLLVVGAFLALSALQVYGSSRPHPATRGAWLGIWWLFLRLALEKSAAPPDVTFAVGIAPALVLILPFAGAYAKRRGMSFGAFMGSVLVMALIHRVVVVAIGYVATTQRLGTHLDLTAITDVHGIVGGEMKFGPEDEFKKIMFLLGFAQLVFWTVLTMVAGLILGGIGYGVTRRPRG